MARSTHYAGIDYRSRLEARWACLVHRLGWTFSYDPPDHPDLDFLVTLPSSRSLYVAVCPATDPGSYLSAARRLPTDLPHRVLVAGASPHPVLGLLGPDRPWLDAHLHLGPAGVEVESFPPDRPVTVESLWRSVCGEVR